MSTTANVLSNLGDGPFVYREIKNTLGILTGPRTYPRIIAPDLRGYNLGLHDELWAEQKVRGSGVETYFARVVPIYGDFSDPNGDPLRGTPTTENGAENKGTTFYFNPFSMDWLVTGYEVWAGTVAGTLYKQGTLTGSKGMGRWLTTFTIGTTWAYNSSGDTLSAQTIGPPAFADTCEIYQIEGATDSRLFLGGGKAYSDGYIQISKSSVAPVLTCGTSAQSTAATWAALGATGSFRMRLRYKEAVPSPFFFPNADKDEWFDFTKIDFTGDASMANVAATIQAKIRATQNPVLYCGTNEETTIATWQAVTDGSFQIYIDGVQYQVTGLDFSGDSSMSDIASTIQTGLQAATSGSETVEYDSTAARFIIKNTTALEADKVTNGGFAADTDWTKGTGWSITGGAAVKTSTGGQTYLMQDEGSDLTGSTYVVTYTVSGITNGGAVNFAQFAFASDAAGSNALLGTQRQADGTYTEMIHVTAGSARQWMGILSRADDGDISIDNVYVVKVQANTQISYLDRHASGTGTDISTYMDGRETSADAVLNGVGKGPTTETVTWSTDHFIITGSDAGDQYDISFLEAATGDVGTDISTSSWMDARSTSTSATQTHGQTALRTVLGDGTDFGPWCQGMRLRVQSEGTRYLVAKHRGSEHLKLDSDYAGDAFGGYVSYELTPLDDQFYPSALGNPFKFSTTDIVKLPTNDSDGITAIRRVGGSVYFFMDHHTWIVDGVDVSFPRVISDHYGAVNTNSTVLYPGGLFVYTGDDVIRVSGARIGTLDPEKRIKQLLTRISTSTVASHAVYLETPDTDLIYLFVGIDSAIVIDTAIVFEPKTGNFWTYNVKDSRVSAVIRDASNNPYMITGSTYDDGHSIPAFTFLHGTSYKNDGASQGSTYDHQGIVASVGSPTTTAGYLTCGALNSAIGTFQSVTKGYFQVEIDGTTRKIGPCDFSGDSDFDDAAATIQAAIRVVTSGTETCVYSTDHFVITSGTTTNRSNVGFLEPYWPTIDDQDISGKTYMNGRTGIATKTGAVSKITLTLYQSDGSTSASCYTDNDAEKGVYAFVCDTNMLNGAYGKIESNGSNTITISPAPSTTPAAGWYWYIGGIVPKWRKWMDFGSPQHKNKTHGVSVTIDPGGGATFNVICLQSMQDLSSTVRTSHVKKIAIGGTQDTVNTFKLADQPATQQGFILLRPNSEEPLIIEDITVTHRPRR